MNFYLCGLKTLFNLIVGNLIANEEESKEDVKMEVNERVYERMKAIRKMDAQGKVQFNNFPLCLHLNTSPRSLFFL